MKKLNLFRHFDWEAFSKDKTFICSGVKYSEKKEMIVAEIAILSDNTDYGDSSVSNVFEKFNVTILNSTEADLNKYSSYINQRCTILNVQKASVWGDYSNRLSLIAQVQLMKN